MEDIAISWFDAGALICEINAMPQMRAASDPAIYERLLAEFMPGEVRVPARLFVCPSDDAARRAALHRALGLDQYNGVADRSGLWVDGARATARFEDGLSAARALLMRKDVRGAVCLMTPKEILGLGLPVNRWSSVVFAASEEFSAQERALVSQVRALLRDSVADAGAPANPTVEAD